VPGYGSEDQGHPAHQADPDYAKYKEGDPSAWAEDVHQPPYPQSNPPAIPGYDVEDQDHPAHKEQPRNPKNASLKAQVEKKAAKCIRVARVMLGCDAAADAVEDQALDLMDVPDENLDSMYARMSGGFMGAEEEVPAEEEDEEIAALLAADEPVEEEDGVMARIKAMEDELQNLKKSAGQNAPGGSQNGANKGGETEEEAKKGEKKAAYNQVRQMVASWDSDGDGFLMQADWQGSSKLFHQADCDGDGIVTIDEGVAPFVDEGAADADLGLDSEETALMAELESQVACGKKAADEEVPAEDEKDEAKEEGKKAADEKEEEKEEEAKEEESKEASDASMFSASGDPLADMTASEDALLREVFGSKKAEDGEEAPAEEEEKEEEAPAEEPEEEEEGKKGGKKDDKKDDKKASAQHPVRPKTASGLKTLGTQVRTAGNKEMKDLAQLWDCAPDVSAVYGIPKSE